MPLFFGNTEIDAVNFNGTNLDMLKMGETTVWESVKYIFNNGSIYGQGVLYESYDVHLSNAQYVSSSVNKIDENGNWLLEVYGNNNSYVGWNVAEFYNVDMVTYSKFIVEYDFSKTDSYNREVFQVVWGAGDYKNYYHNGVCDLKDQKIVIDCSGRPMITPYISIKVGITQAGGNAKLKIKKIYLE